MSASFIMLLFRVQYEVLFYIELPLRIALAAKKDYFLRNTDGYFTTNVLFNRLCESVFVRNMSTSLT